MSSEQTGSAGFYEIVAWLETHKKQLMTGVVVVAALALIVSYAVWHKNQKEIEASAALLKVGSVFGSGEEMSQPPAAEYLKVAANYASTGAGERASLLAAGAYFNENQFAEALSQFKKFQSDYSGSVLVPIAAIGIATCLESQGNIDEALKAYQDVISRYASDPVAGQAKFALGRLYEAKNQPEQALKYYDELLHQTARSVWTSGAADQKEQLLIKHPNLAPRPPATSAISGESNMIPVLLDAKQTNIPIIFRTNAPAKPATNAAALSISNTTAKLATNGTPLTKTNPAALSVTNKPKQGQTNAPAVR